MKTLNIKLTQKEQQKLNNEIENEIRCLIKENTDFATSEKIETKITKIEIDGMGKEYPLIYVSFQPKNIFLSCVGYVNGSIYEYPILRLDRNMKDLLTDRNWKEGNNCFFKKMGQDTWYYNIEANTFSVDGNNCGIQEYVCEGSIHNLEKIENDEF
ncbi:hypothetical protein [Clostridium sp.]|uniref:hypothetical protein n=1 Tax=Clostridium sp. TaxID=1506 RepID=UPI002622E2E2|nr:hypothetical protein [Clostridium sp.]